MGTVFRPRPGSPGIAPILPVDRGPTAAELASLEAGLPAQPLRLGVVLAGDRELPGWWGGGRPAGWQDAIEAVREVLRPTRVPFRVTAHQHAARPPAPRPAIRPTDEPGIER